jgi:hypothetical protein
LIIWVFLDYLSSFQRVTDVMFSNVALEHTLYSVNPEYKPVNCQPDFGSPVLETGHPHTTPSPGAMAASASGFEVRSAGAPEPDFFHRVWMGFEVNYPLAIQGRQGRVPPALRARSWGIIKRPRNCGAFNLAEFLAG